MNVDARTAGDITRSILGFVCGLAVAHGWLDGNAALSIPFAISSLVVAFWPMFVHPPRPRPVILPINEDNQ
jgi:hypothetical protein